MATFTDERLIEAWARIDGIAEVAHELGATYAAVNNRAMRLRLQGVPLRGMRSPSRRRGGQSLSSQNPVGQDSGRIGVESRGDDDPSTRGVDPEELRDLVEAFRSSVRRRPSP
jgi:hypothetical protein